MSRRPPVEMLEVAAADLAELCDEVVFVGGAIVPLLITDPAAPPVSSTKDLDVVVSVATNYEYTVKLGDRLRQLGFSEDTDEDAPVCRWRRRDGLKLDVMPTDPKILNFSNRWFPLAFESKVRAALPSGREIQVATASCFLGTKLEAFISRGHGDYLGSKDIEDLLAVIHGRESIVSEVGSAPKALQDYLSLQLQQHLEQEAFTNSIEGHLPGEDREMVLRRLRRIISLNES